MKHSVQVIMSKHPHSVFSAAPLAGAYQKMRALKVRHLPVVDGNGKIVGIISDRDFQRVMTRERISETEESYSFDARDCVEHVMSWPVKLIPSKESIQSAARLMLEEKLSALVVANDELHPIGIVTTDDFLRYLAQTPLEAISAPAPIYPTQSQL